MDPLVFPIVLFAIFIQTLAGFGFGLIAMPLLIAAVGLDVAAPALALTGLVSGSMIILEYLRDLRVRDVWHLWLASFMAVPIGVWGSQRLDENVVLYLLGVVIILYALFRLRGLSIPALGRRWGPGFGVFSGLLQGAYNIGGPPLIIYGASQRWDPKRFKGNLQVIFFVNGILTIATHFASGNVTNAVVGNVFLMVPAAVIGVRMGFWCDRFILNPHRFYQGVMVLLMALGVSLLLR